jgi:hydroxylysine kinase
VTAQLRADGGIPYQGGLAAGHVRMAEAEAERLAAQLYRETATATRLDTEKDDTFRLDGAGGRRLIMKVANPAEPRSEIAFQVALLRHVAERDPALPLPRVIPELEGRSFGEITDDAGQDRTVRLLTFINGTPLDRAPSSPAQRRHVGATLGRLRHAMAAFDHPGASRVLAWDVRHLLELADGLAAVPDPERRAQLERGLERFAAVAPAVSRLRRQVLHNDFSKSNLIVDRDDPQRLAGVIDFGDAVRTAIAIDVSTALLNQLPRDLDGDLDGDIFAAGRDLLAGYLEVADLTEEELGLLPLLVMARVIARAIITHRRAELFPDNARYIMRNTEPGWAQLAWFLRRSTEEVSTTFADVMNSSPRLEGSDS